MSQGLVVKRENSCCSQQGDIVAVADLRGTKRLCVYFWAGGAHRVELAGAWASTVGIFSMLSFVPSLIITGSLDSTGVPQITMTERREAFCPERAGKRSNPMVDFVTQNPPCWHFPPKDTRLELGGILKKRNDPACQDPEVVITRYYKGELWILPLALL